MIKVLVQPNEPCIMGLIKHLSPPQFLFDLAIMYVILVKISMLSECFQNRNRNSMYMHTKSLKEVSLLNY